MDAGRCEIGVHSVLRLPDRHDPAVGLDNANNSLVAAGRRATARTWSAAPPTFVPTPFSRISLQQARLLLPVVHTHIAIHRHGLREVLVRVLPSPIAPVEPPETEVAVGDKRAHAKCLCQP